MKNTLAALAVAVGALLGPPAQAAIVVSFAPSAATVAPGSTFSVDINVGGLGTSPAKGVGSIVSGFAFDVLYDGLLLTGVSATENATIFGTPTERVFGPATIGSANISIDGTSFLSDLDLLALQPDDSYTLVTLFFQVGATEGDSTLRFGNVPPFHSNLLGPLDDSGLSATHDASYGTACVSVRAPGTSLPVGPCAVAEPATAALAGLALAVALLPAALRSRQRH